MPCIELTPSNPLRSSVAKAGGSGNETTMVPGEKKLSAALNNALRMFVTSLLFSWWKKIVNESHAVVRWNMLWNINFWVSCFMVQLWLSKDAQTFLNHATWSLTNAFVNGMGSRRSQRRFQCGRPRFAPLTVQRYSALSILNWEEPERLSVQYARTIFENEPRRLWST